MMSELNLGYRRLSSVGYLATAVAVLTMGLSLALPTSSADAAFGVAPGSYTASLSSTQAGGHADFRLSFAFNTHPDPTFTIFPDADAKSLVVDLPPGLVGNPQATPKCSADFLRLFQSCPADTQIGVMHYTLPVAAGPPVVLGTPLYNMVPESGRVAELGFVNTYLVNPQVHILASVRTGGDYGVRTEVPRLPGNLHPSDAGVEIWGVPEDPSHDSQRGSVLDPNGGCLDVNGVSTGSCPSHLPPRPFLSNPTQCSTPVSVSMTVDSYQAPGQFIAPLISTPQLMTGCDKLPFDPSISLKPATASAGAPAAYSVDLHLPQSDSPIVPQTADLKKATVTLPEGVTVSPPAADGLQACSDAQIALNDASEPTCPDASKIGSVQINSPLLAGPIEGGVYEGTQTPQHLLRVFIVAQGFGVLVKLPGSVDLDQQTGRITATFDNNPQLPFEDFLLTFKGGPRAPLSNPRSCGTKTTTATLTSYAGQTATATSSFVISKDGNGAPCTPYAFSPTLAAGTINPAAGMFSPFGLQLQRTDNDGEFRSLASLSLPPGLLADVGSVSVRCTEAQADAHACPAESHIGSVNVGAGAGSDPIYVPGDVYLMGGFSSGPFAGDPFGLAVVVHATAGPFDLGYVVVKAGLQVHDDGSITTQTEPFPSILQGVPLRLKDIRVSLDRPDFILNPTSCAQMAIAGTVTSIEGQSAGVSSPFQVGECARLAFKPSFSASTSAKTSKADGASLHVHLATSQGPSSAHPEANIAKVNVQLPKVLPSRLTTLQQACTAGQFERDPAGCPSGSFVGTAIAHSPILRSQLAGPAILVSHGGVAFPDLVLVLQGEGIRLDLTGHTQIKNGITFSRFETVPDAPVSSFDLNLPQGPHSVLAANGNLCANTKTVTTTRRVTRRVKGHSRKVTIRVKKTVATPLLMPTTITGQNGAVLSQRTKIAVGACAAAKRATRARAEAKKRR